MNFIEYKEKAVINLENVSAIQSKLRHKEPVIVFSISSDVSSVVWIFTTTEERDAVYKHVLQLANCHEIVIEEQTEFENN